MGKRIPFRYALQQARKGKSNPPPMAGCTRLGIVAAGTHEHIWGPLDPREYGKHSPSTYRRCLVQGCRAIKEEQPHANH